MEENKEVAEEATQQVEETTKQTQEPSVSLNEDGDIKLDLTKIPVENAQAEQEQSTDTNEEEPVQEEPVQEEPVEEEVAEVATETSNNDDVEEFVDLPENVQKLMEFMEETGGSLNDYVNLNKDVKEMDDSEVMADYYRNTKPHLNDEEINFLLEDKFSYDEEVMEEREVKRKKLALKEQVAEARAHLEESKTKYYEEIKGGSKLNDEQKKALDFYNDYNAQEEQNMEIVKLQQSTFLDKTNKVFDKNFKGFEFNIGDKTMTYDIQNIDNVKDKQVDINNFVGKFLNDKALMDDAAGYHKGLFTAMNPDAIAKHFYEQGKSDAIRQTVSESKNINTSRESHKVYEGEGGVKFKVLGDSANDMKLRIKKRK